MKDFPSQTRTWVAFMPHTWEGKSALSSWFVFRNCWHSSSRKPWSGAQYTSWNVRVWFALLKHFYILLYARKYAANVRHELTPVLLKSFWGKTHIKYRSIFTVWIYYVHPARPCATRWCYWPCVKLNEPFFFFLNLKFVTFFFSLFIYNPPGF